MKKKHIIPCLAMLALLFANISLAQRIRLEGTDNILAALRSSKFDTLLAALRKIEDKKIVGAIPILEERIWQQDPDMQEFFLRTLWKLGSPNTLALARAYIDTANGFSSIRPMPRDPLRMKVLAIDILFSYGDYATASLVFELLERDKPYVDPFARNLLASIARSVPNFSEKAKNLLVEISAKDSSPRNRSLSLNDLISLYGLGVVETVRYVASKDSAPENRYFALHSLMRLNDPQLRPFLYERLPLEPEWTYRIRIADSLLDRLGSPEDYRVVQEYQPQEPNPTARSRIRQEMRKFTPPVPSSAMPVPALLDTVISTNHQVFTYGWIGDKNFVNELDNALQNARKHLTRGDSTNCRKEVETFQEKVQKEYDRTVDREKKNQPRDKRFVTVEGWKFLYYNATYLLDRLPKKK